MKETSRECRESGRPRFRGKVWRLLPAVGICASAVAAFAGSAAAAELDSAELIGTTDKPAIGYRCGETMTITLKLWGADAKAVGNDYRVNWVRTGDDGKTEQGTFPVAGLPFVYRTSIDRPGFVRLRATVVDAKGAAYRKSFVGDASTPEGKQAMNRFEARDKRVFFDGGAGADVGKISSVPEPADFDAFWARRRERLAKVPPEAEYKPVPCADRELKVFAVSIRCAGAHPSTGYLTVPAKAGRYPVCVHFHGYGHTYPDRGYVIRPFLAKDGRIHFVFSPHGYELGREREYYAEFFRSICSGGTTFGFDERQNADPEVCYFSGFTYRIMRALEWLKTRPEWDGRNLTVTGGSMGGMQSVWAAALDRDVTSCEPVIPWNCDIGGRETLKRTIDPWHIRETAALRYYDPVNMAKRIPASCRVNVKRAGLGDYCCPPSGVMAFWNALSCPKSIKWIQGSTHGYVPSAPENQVFTVGEKVR